MTTKPFNELSEKAKQTWSEDTRTVYEVASKSFQNDVEKLEDKALPNQSKDTKDA